MAQAVAMVACLEAGFRLGARDGRRAGAHKGLGAIEAALFALLGLLLGFAFAGATSRLDARRELIVHEANAIGTAYLRTDLLPAAAQSEVRALFRRYVEARLRAFDRSLDAKGLARASSDASALQQNLWAAAIAARGLDATGDVARVVIPALNEMIDVTTARMVAQQTRLPALILWLLVGLSLLSALVAGYAMAARGRRSVLHMMLYAAAISLTTYAVLDLDNPRLGLIRLDAAERVLQRLHDSIR
jgi:hypothetical protein